MITKGTLTILVQTDEGDVKVAYSTDGDANKLAGTAKDFINRITQTRTKDMNSIEGAGVQSIDLKKVSPVGFYSPTAKDSSNAPPSASAENLRTLSPDKSAFVAFRCKHCNETILGVNSPNGTCTCPHCHKETRVPAELINAEYSCPSCGAKAYLFMEKGAITNIGCKDCHSPIDLFFIEKLGKYQSADYGKRR